MHAIDRFAPYTPVLWILSAIGLFGINGVFLYYAFFEPEVLAVAQHNPVSLVFMVEAFLLVALAAWMIAKLGLQRPGWLAFVVMSIVGSLFFSVPFFLLLHIRKYRRAHAP